MDAETLLKVVSPELPAELKTKLRETSREDMLAEAVVVFGEATFELLIITRNIQTRCGVCRVAEQECAHCQADGLRVMEVIKRITVLSAAIKEACSPGSRIAAQAEARAEAKVASTE